MKIGHITAPYFCAGVIVSDYLDTVTEAAPIIKYMKGWTKYKVIDYCLKKHWKLEWTLET